MKNRYFGDVYDYIKYALLRQLIGREGTSTAVCWMLTEDDNGKDGRNIAYLEQPEKWSSFDNTVYDFLRRQVVEERNRSIRAIEKSNLLPSCRFYRRKLTDDLSQRQHYFDQFLRFARGAEFVFFDPDNGVEVKSVKYGRRNSSKYLFWSEIERAHRAYRSLLIYQHLPPKPRRPLINQVAETLLQVCRSSVVFSIRASKVVFFLVPGRDILPRFRNSLSVVGRTWGGTLTVSEHGLN